MKAFLQTWFHILLGLLLAAIIVAYMLFPYMKGYEAGKRDTQKNLYGYVSK